MSGEISHQAERVIKKLGGFSFVAKSLERDVTSIYKWTYAKADGGTDGLIPSSAMNDVLDLAEMMSITLTSEDLDPR